MDISRAIQYIFEDKKWLEKLTVLALFSFLSAIPLLGLIPLAIVIGYALQIADNVRNGLPRPLPKWGALGEFLTSGGHLVVAVIVYHLPLVLLNACIWGLGAGLGGSLFGGAANLFLLCCLVPFSILYLIMSGTLLAIGSMRYIQTRKPASLYRIGFYFSLITDHIGLVIQWLLSSFGVNIVLALVGWIPCLGQIIFLLFAIPIQAHLLGQFALELGRRR